MKQKVSVTVSRYTRLVNAVLYDNETIEFEIDHEKDVSELSEDELVTLLNDRDLLWSASYHELRGGEGWSELHGHGGREESRPFHGTACVHRAIKQWSRSASVDRGVLRLGELGGGRGVESVRFAGRSADRLHKLDRSARRGAPCRDCPDLDDEGEVALSGF